MTADGTHRMGRRSFHNRYTQAGTYHITLHAAQGLGQPLGHVAGDLSKADGEQDAPHVALSAVGQMVEEELTGSISRFYPMVEVQEHVVMPEHLHAILVVHSTIVSPQGRIAHLGQVIAGFKKGCNRRFWALQEGQAAGQLGKPAAAGAAQGARAAVSPLPERPPSGGSFSGRKPLFAEGYVDVMPLKEGQLETQREYIRQNPRCRLLRMSHRDWLFPKRCAIETALSVKALMGYLRRECGPRLFTAATQAFIESRLLVKNGYVVCDCYGNRELLSGRGNLPPHEAANGRGNLPPHKAANGRLLQEKPWLLPVVCHRRDAGRFAVQKARCLEAARLGSVLVSARIAKGEQEIMDAAAAEGFATVRIVENGFAERYHPSDEMVQRCAEGKLLLVSPWRYGYRAADATISVAECKTMNGVAQTLCRTPDQWWAA